MFKQDECSCSEELPVDGSDVLSAISNEEISVGSEIFDKPDQPGQPLQLGDLLQVRKNAKLKFK